MKKIGWLLLLMFMLLLTACSSEDTSTPADTEEDTATEEQVEMEDEASSDEGMMEDEEASEDGEMTEEEPAEEEMTTEAEVVSGDVASPLLAQGETTAFQFDTVGTYGIHCDPHPVMKMTVTVEEGAELSGTVEAQIADYEFSEDLVVAPGTVIIWTNEDPVRHNVAVTPEG
ncbi:plastocyanin/azurin family copper-binding protein [Jeotgalibacillus aurantiacus]|uniref:plastocyanin/azurin family copper-binding protein n=1 Tax=Jeotgalibacillus aurantiacus TaxID=2763266 RepID=UPI001D0B3C66|nr:plastocyanin/azurin family copper-binding protein [Jeotgalibacillus aurantiacus]